MTLSTSLRAILLADNAIAEATAGVIRPMLLHEGDDLTRGVEGVVYHVISDVRVRTMSGPTQEGDARYQFVVRGRNHDAVDVLRQLISDRLDCFQGVSLAHQVLVFVDDEADAGMSIEKGDGDEPIYRRDLDCLVAYKPAPVTD